jgi:hypothetical protein
MTVDYYKNREYISNSQLDELLKSPKQFKLNLDYPSEPTDEMKFGTLFHTFILEPTKFDNDVRVFDGKKPQNEQQKSFCVFCKEFDPVAAFKMCYSVKNKSDKKVQEESESLYNELQDYIRVYSTNKNIISLKEYQSLLQMKTSIFEHKRAKELLEVKGTVELPIYWEFLGVKIKSKPDKFIIDRENNVLTLIDLKTTDRIYTFGNSFRKYNYARQLACYYLALVSQSEKLGLDNPSSEWKIIAVESGGLYETKVINISEDIVQQGVNDFTYLIEKYKLHLQYGFDYNIDYYLGSGDEELILTI